jgi:type I restriction enzyme S subunit
MKAPAAMPKYETYKDSGIKWLGEIPAHWNTARFRNAFSFDKGLNITKDNLQEHGVLCVSYGEVHSKYGFELNPDKHVLKCVSDDYLMSSPKSLLHNGDFIFADTSEDIDGSGNFTQLISDHQIFAGYHTVITRSIINANKRFLAYALDSVAYRNQIRKRVKGVKVYSITKGLLKDTVIWLPSEAEQTTIAHFLDQKTAQIDAAIAIKEQQIALLKERKQILIQQAVTRGVGFGFAQPTGSDRSLSEAEGNSGVPMKDSGVEWIGEIPAHWEVYANRVLFSERVESGREDLPLLSVSIHSGVSSEEISEEDNVRGRIKIEDKTKYLLVKPGDIAFNMMRAWQGAIGAVRTEGMVSPAYIVAKPKSYISAEYFEYQYRCPDFIKQMDRFSKGITDFRKRLYWDGFKQLYTVVPPQNEQSQIEAYIQIETEKTNESVNLMNQQIEKLREYKTTLINSAVTGKIRVTPEMAATAGSL